MKRLITPALLALAVLIALMGTASGSTIGRIIAVIRHELVRYEVISPTGVPLAGANTPASAGGAAIAADHTASFGETIRLNSTAATRTVTLPTITLADIGKRISIRHDGTSNTVVVETPGAETINGASTGTLTTQYESWVLEALSTTEWGIM